jgi:hypothetical protein
MKRFGSGRVPYFGGQGDKLRNTLIIAGLLVATVVGLAPHAVRAETVIVQSENYTVAYELLYSPIQIVSEAGCGGGYKLMGLDAPGEWVEYDLTISAFGSWSTFLVCRGDTGVNYHLQLTLTGKGSGFSQTIDINFVGDQYG